MMLQEAAETDGLKAVVSEGAGVRSVREAVKVNGADKVIFSWLFGVTTIGTTVFTSNLPPRCLTDLSAEITEPALFIHATPGQGGETLTEELLRGGEGAQGVLGGAGRAHRRDRRRAGGVRATGRQVLRPLAGLRRRVALGSTGVDRAQVERHRED